MTSTKASAATSDDHSNTKHIGQHPSNRVERVCVLDRDGPRDLCCTQPRLGGGSLDITRAALVVALPPLIINALLIGLIFHHHIPHTPSSPESLLGSGDVYEGSAYYVDFSAPRLITVSSWASTVISWISTFAIGMTSYPLAKMYIQQSRMGALSSLPSPYQLHLLIKIFGGGLGALWSWVTYCWQRQRTRQVRLLFAAAMALLAVVLLGFAILAADTWLHVTTSTVPYSLLMPVDGVSTSYGRGLEADCFGDFSGACTAGQDAGASKWIRGSNEAYRTLANLSSVNAVAPCRVYNRDFAYLTDANRNSSFDFRANTFAISTKCKPVSKECSLQTNSWCGNADECVAAELWGIGLSYRCSSHLYGDLNNNTGSSYSGVNGNSAGLSSNIGFFMQLFSDANVTQPIGKQSGPTPNPFYFVTGARVPTSDPLSLDYSEIVADPVYTVASFLYSCQSTIYELTYDFVNGSAVAIDHAVANETMSENVGWPFIHNRAYAQTSLETAFISGAQQSDTAQQLGDFFALQFSQIALSLISGIMSPRKTLAEQHRQALLVARIPKAPFFTLIALNLLYALLGIGLATIAFCSHPSHIRDVQARLSIAGLVAALLESGRVHVPGKGIEGLFEEYAGKDEARVALMGVGYGKWSFQHVEKQRVRERAGHGNFEKGDAPKSIPPSEEEGPRSLTGESRNLDNSTPIREERDESVSLGVYHP